MQIAASPSVFARMTGVGAALIGAVGLAGWLLQISVLKSVLPGAVEMKANTAIALLLGGFALEVLRGHPRPMQLNLVRCLAVMLASLGVVTGVQFLFGLNLGIDEFIFRDAGTYYSAAPGQMSPYSAVAFGSIGVALFALTVPRLSTLAWFMSILTAGIGALSLLGYVWNASELVTDDVLPPVAVHTAFAFFLLGAGALLAGKTDVAAPVPQAMNRVSVEARVAWGFVGAFALLVLGGGIAYRSFAELIQSEEWVAHTQAVRAELGFLYAAVAESESAARTYVLVGASWHQHNFSRHAATARERSQALRRMVSDSASQSQQWRMLDALVTQRLQMLEHTLKVYDSEGEQSGKRVVATERGTQVMEALGAKVAEMDRSEVALLAEREHRAKQHRQSTLLFLMVLLSAAALMFAGLLRSVGREMHARSLADERLQLLNAELERRVKERTVELEDNQRRFVELFESAPDAFVLARRDGAIIQVNRQAEALFKWSRSELLGQSVEVLVPPDQRAGHVALLEHYLNASTPQGVVSGRENLRGLCKDGSEIPVDICLSPLQFGEEQVVLAAIRDTSERERMGNALQQSVALYLHTLDNMLEGCQVIDFDWRYLFVNKVAGVFAKKSPESLIGRSMMESFKGIEHTEVFAMMRRCMEQRLAHRDEIEFSYEDGSKAWFDLVVLPAPQGIALFSLDISERKRAEEAILSINADLERRIEERTQDLVKAREAADSANRAKSAFLATMSHEIRTPMNGVVGMVEVLAQSRLTPYQTDAVQTIKTSAFALLRLIDDILDFSKIEAGKMALEREPVQLIELIESVSDTLRPIAAQKNVALSLFIAPRVPKLIWGDSMRLRQVLFNLAGNAIKFSAGQAERCGVVSIRADIAQDDPTRLVICVADNGIGMTSETRNSLFSRFTQASVSTTRRFGGTGLGLAICKRLVVLMDGEIEVNSAPNEGATFTVELPVELVEEGGWQPQVDLSGLACIVVGACTNVDDLRVYLAQASAKVHVVDELNDAARLFNGLSPAVIIHNGADPAPSVETLRGHFEACPDVRHLVLTPGWHHRLRVISPDMVMLDRNGLRRDWLLHAVAVAAGKALPDNQIVRGDQDTIEAALTPLTVAEARQQGCLILVAEDDLVNQKVILRQLHLLGHAAEIAESGVEALRMWQTGGFALLLTDLHMPDMDGYTLAESIRREESERGNAAEKRLPILALTANALRGEALRAKAVGMDEYLTKPLQLHLLKAALDQWLPTGRPELSGGALQASVDDTAVSVPEFDVSVLEELVGAEPAVVREFLVNFRSSAQKVLTEFADAQAVGAVSQISAIAHKLKSSSRSVGAMELGDRCAELENACRMGTGDFVAQSLAEVKSVLSRVEARIDDLLGKLDG